MSLSEWPPKSAWVFNFSSRLASAHRKPFFCLHHLNNKSLHHKACACVESELQQEISSKKAFSQTLLFSTIQHTLGYFSGTMRRHYPSIYTGKFSCQDMEGSMKRLSPLKRTCLCFSKICSICMAANQWKHL